ncbi:Uncharacterised protein family (UPF0715) [Bacillus sp. OV322]|uniref:UPF0715 family protein n=1 Tax=Bacillus sp. OV322 TaxID=1882764 RepID=UPI0008F41D27|nr:Uncharacterised protein family (UPF0715) [Bacillus sp. OV322]
MKIWRLSEIASDISDTIPYYFLCLSFSSISFSVAMIILIREPSWLRPMPIAIYSFYVFLSYLLFAVPLQAFFNKHPKKFSFLYLLFYILFSFIALFIVYILINLDFTMNVVKMAKYYEFSLAAAVIYWIWDSVFLQKKINDY